MKDFINGIIKAGYEQWMGFIAICFTSAASVITIAWMVADHTPQCYYLETEASAVTELTGYQVKALVNWGIDITSFASSDPELALDVIADLKRCASK